MGKKIWLRRQRSPSVRTLFGVDGRESGVSSSRGAICYKSCDVFVQPAFFLWEIAQEMVWPSRRVQKLVYFRNLFSRILSIRICDRSAQFLVDCLEIFMATNNSGFNSTYMFACE